MECKPSKKMVGRLFKNKDHAQEFFKTQQARLEKQILELFYGTLRRQLRRFGLSLFLGLHGITILETRTNQDAR